MFDLTEKSSCEYLFCSEHLSVLILVLNLYLVAGLAVAFGPWPMVNKVVLLFCFLLAVTRKYSPGGKDSLGRVISLLIRIDNVNLNPVNIYAPTNLSDRKIFFDSLHDLFFSSAALIIGGDFHCYDKALDKFGGNFSVHKDYDDLKTTFRLLDVWRRLHPTSREFTWFNLDM